MKAQQIHIGRFTKKDSIKLDRKISREIGLENSTGWVSTHKVHKSDKTYNRKPKHMASYVDNF